MPHNIILVGYRGTGKTTVGRLLAQRLGRAFADVDDAIEAAAGKSVADIFAAESETGFRNREAAALTELCARSEHVIATGGGAILRAANRRAMKASGFVVWLTAVPEIIWERMLADPTTLARRPNLTPGGGEAEVRALLAARDARYRAVADFAVASDTVSPDGVADAIITAWTVSRGSETSESPATSGGQ